MIHSFLGSKIYPRWPKEKVPTEADLYRTIPYSKVNLKKSIPSSACFNDYDLSCYWGKYSSGKEILEIFSKQYKTDTKTFKNPDHFFVCQFFPKNCIEQHNEYLVHDPEQFFPTIKGRPNTRAHVLLVGNNEDIIRVKNRAELAEKAVWIVFDPERCKALQAANNTPKSKK